jgi:serine/threonine protein kinase
MIGETVSHYRIVEKLGEGGMGIVYRAQDTELDRLVALKALPPDTAGDPERRARLLREARTASGLNHPNIVTIHDVIRRDEGDFIVMELVPGRRSTS